MTTQPNGGAIPQTHFRTPLFPTPFHARTSPLCRANAWTRWAGFATVDCYSDVETEYFAIRNAATLYDLSPMIKYRIAGPDAVDYLNRLITRDVAKLAPGRVGYVVWCDDAGKVLDDGTLFHLTSSEFRLCCQERHLPWLLDSAIGFDVEVDDVTEDIAALSLQGPTSCAVLKRLRLDSIETLKPFWLQDFGFENATLTVSRTGFTGDLGYEMWVDPGLAETLWDRLMDAGRAHGIRPIGSRALDLARIEAGFIQTNTDFMSAAAAIRPNRGRSPFELGLGRLVDFRKSAHFIGRRALLCEVETRSSRYRLVGLDIEGNKPAHGALIYGRRRREVGAVTSAMWSSTCKKNIALASIDARCRGDKEGLSVEIYTNKELKWDKAMARCRIVDRPFFNPPRRLATPARDF